MKSPFLSFVQQDKFWGFVLIGLGVLALTLKPFDKIDAWLHGRANTALTWMLVGLGIVAIVIALRGTPTLKALAIFWIVTP